MDAKQLILFFKKISPKKNELGEQDVFTSSPSSSVSKWSSGRKFGKTYMNDPKYKWSSDRTLGKTYMNDPKYKWSSNMARGKANNLF